MKPQHSVKVTADFEVRLQLGALVVTIPGTGETQTVDATREHVSTYKEGTVCRFGNKKDALAFWKTHITTTLYMGKV